MYGISPDKLLLYKENKNKTLSNEAILFLQKIREVEYLFSQQVQQFSYQSKVDIMNWEYNNRDIKKGRLTADIIIEDFSNPNITNPNKNQQLAIQFILSIDQKYVNSRKISDSTDISTAQTQLEHLLNDFLCIEKINRDNRFDLYLSKVDCYFNESNRQSFIHFIESLRDKTKYEPKTLELFGKQLNIIPSQLIELSTNQYQHDSEDFIRFAFKNIIQNHICVAVEHALKNKNTKVENITLNINPGNKTIETILNEYDQLLSSSLESNALIPQEMEVNKSINIDIQDLDKSLQTAVQTLWKTINQNNYATPKDIKYLHKDIINYAHKQILNESLTDNSNKPTNKSVL